MSVIRPTLKREIFQDQQAPRILLGEGTRQSARPSTTARWRGISSAAARSSPASAPTSLSGRKRRGVSDRLTAPESAAVLQTN
jgi:hypothetical protein